METNEEKSDFVFSSREDEATSEHNLNASSNEAIIESSACNEPNIEESQANGASDSSQNGTGDASKKPAMGFKKPRALIIGPKRGKIGKIHQVINDKCVSSTSNEPLSKQTTETIQLQNDMSKIDESTLKNTTEESVTSNAKNIPIPYLEPSWGGKPEEKYKFEVLKSGVILETIDLTNNSFHIVGRLPSCNLSLAHPTISRYHAIIQYRAIEDDKNSKGFYLYDLESTHGTFWNGHRIKPRSYVRLHGGHMIRFGCSQRKYILQAPLEDQEEESELSVTQLKEKRQEELREREIKLQEEKEAEERARQAEENEGIDWGMGEDADEETDLTENPYASMTEEELYLDDPKKTLRGWFEREGYDLQYQVEEKGIGQFLCWVNLPKECFGGRSIKAEALVKGKKKESVVQCALEACRILDRHGLLRQANHESRKKKSRNWEEEDYYDSDEDNFLDRTGEVERKREQRMKLAGKFEEKVETYSSLTEKHNEIMNKISHLTNRLKESQENNAKGGESSEDSLDAFMSSLNTSILSKSDVTKMKIELQNLRKEETRLVKLINLTKPANLPLLVSQEFVENKDSQQTSKLSMRKISQLEKRRQLFEAKTKNDSEKAAHSLTSANNEEEEEEEDEIEDNTKEGRENEIHTGDVTREGDANESKCEDTRKSEVESLDITRIDNKTTCISRNVSQDTEISDQDANVEDNKKRKKDRKPEKSKSTKRHYDQDVHSADYSTWVPPKDQTGDGRTSLNDKYGY